jgi:hypothetical protein
MPERCCALGVAIRTCIFRSSRIPSPKRSESWTFLSNENTRQFTIWKDHLRNRHLVPGISVHREADAAKVFVGDREPFGLPCVRQSAHWSLQLPAWCEVGEPRRRSVQRG